MAQGLRARWLLAFDGVDHVVVDHGVVVWENGAIIHVGRQVPIGVTDIVELPHHLVMPGLICLHFHA
ncbi:MAG: hypothetical protein NZ518_05110, partial [Dehalococcoidia bacterium]|nr:hypothetical protein [Dehalococcoidia bacterium]